MLRPPPLIACYRLLSGLFSGARLRKINNLVLFFFRSARARAGAGYRSARS